MRMRGGLRTNMHVFRLAQCEGNMMMVWSGYLVADADQSAKLLIFHKGFSSHVTRVCVWSAFFMSEQRLPPSLGALLALLHFSGCSIDLVGFTSLDISPSFVVSPTWMFHQVCFIICGCFIFSDCFANCVPPSLPVSPSLAVSPLLAVLVSHPTENQLTCLLP